MEQAKYDVFISYRRSDSTERAHLVKEIMTRDRYLSHLRVVQHTEQPTYMKEDYYLGEKNNSYC